MHPFYVWRVEFAVEGNQMAYPPEAISIALLTIMSSMSPPTDDEQDATNGEVSLNISVALT